MSRGGWRKKASEDDGWGGRGGYMAAKVSKLDEQFRMDAPREKQKEGACSSIFSGVAIYVNGFTDPSADELRRLMMLHGGQFHVYYSRSKTTHIIATNLPNSKIKELKGEKVVRPEWITDSIKAGQQLSYVKYQLYAKQKGLTFPIRRPGLEHEPNGPSLTSCQSAFTSCLTHHGNQELEPRHRNGVHKGLETRLNGIVEEENERLSPCVTQSVEWTLTNGHNHSINGALKSSNSVLHLGRLPHQKQPHQWPPPPIIESPDPQPSSDNIPISTNSPSPKSRKIWLNGAPHSVPVHTNPSTGSNMISEFYSHSRLHHISTWKSEFSEYVNSLQQRRGMLVGAEFPGRERLRRQKIARGRGSPAGPPTRQPCILHVDMDCFFVSVGIRHRPDLKGRPVAVTSNRGQGRVAQRPGADPQLEVEYYKRKLAQKADKKETELEMTPSPDSVSPQSNNTDHDLAALSMAEVASCSYEARQAGVRNGMFFGQAKRLCPELQSVPYDFQAYKEVAMAMYETLASYTHRIEALSCDEALVDATSLLTDLGVSAADLAHAIRADVQERTGCSASVGMGSNILLARMATRRAKPDGQYYLKPEEVDEFIQDQPVSSLPGVGRTMGAKLSSMGVQTCGDMQQISMARLQKEFGPRTGQTLFRFCRGLDDRPVRSEKERKSVSAEMNYGIRFTEVVEAETFLENLSLELQRRLQGAGLCGRRITLKVMVRKPGAPIEPAKFGGHGICDTLARTVTLEQPTDSAQVITAEVVKLLHAMKVNVMDMRGVGLQVQQLLSSGTVTGHGRSIKDLLLAQQTVRHEGSSCHVNADILNATGRSPGEPSVPGDGLPPALSGEPVPGTSKEVHPPRYNGGLRTPKRFRAQLDLSIEVPSPSQVDRSVLEALPAELRAQVEQSWRRKEELPNGVTTSPALVLQFPHDAGEDANAGIVLELPDFTQVDPEVFAALPAELQDELRSAYGRRDNVQPQSTTESRNPLLQLKQASAATRTKRRYKRKNLSPAKGGSSPLKSRLHGNSPAKGSPLKQPVNGLKTEHKDHLKLKNETSTSSLKPDVQENLAKATSRCAPTLAGACDFTDIRTLLREWVTTITEPMEEDILQVVKFCTELIEDRDLEKLDLVIKYMKRLMQQSVDSVWSMAFDFILDNVQVVIQQTYGSTLKIT